MNISIPPLPRSGKVNSAGHLEVAGCDVLELTEEFGTPLYIYDEEQIRDNCQRYLESFSRLSKNTEIVYASKAFTCVAMCQLIGEEQLSLDIASGGELYTALKAWFPPERIFVHGNANSRDELERYIRSEVGHIVVDSLDELDSLDRICAETGRRQPILLRITPGIEAHTHDFVQTGKLDSKFGFCLAEGVAIDAAARALKVQNLTLEGFHVHIGSQIFSLDPYEKTIQVMADFMLECKEKYDFDCRMLDIGGGLGVAYADGDEPPAIESLAETIVSSMKKEMERIGQPLPRIAVEPGRSIVANAGITAYTVETIKTVPGVRTFIGVSGGMSDNLRPMLYGAKYEALLAERPEADPVLTASIAGKHCESGDILVKDVRLPETHLGDILVTPSTGAYGYTMANNYNGQPRPAVVFVKNGQARVVIRRESYEGLVHLHERLD